MTAAYTSSKTNTPPTTSITKRGTPNHGIDILAIMQAPTETPPEIAALVRQRLRARSGAERFEMDSRMFEAARDMVPASFPRDLTEAERKKALYLRFYSTPLPNRPLMSRAAGYAPTSVA